jgi:hypothetical protein
MFTTYHMLLCLMCYIIMLYIHANYSMLLGKPHLRDAKITHDWRNNAMTIQGNGMIITIMVIKHLGVKVK